MIDFDRGFTGAPEVERTLTECSVLTEICQESSSNRGFTGAPEVAEPIYWYPLDFSFQAFFLSSLVTKIFISYTPPFLLAIFHP